jgi:hypothetical protein
MSPAVDGSQHHHRRRAAGLGPVPNHRLSPGGPPRHCFEEFVDLVVPELQRRGGYRTQYPGATLRDPLLEY